MPIASDRFDAANYGRADDCALQRKSGIAPLDAKSDPNVWFSRFAGLDQIAMSILFPRQLAAIEGSKVCAVYLRNSD